MSNESTGVDEAQITSSGTAAEEVAGFDLTAAPVKQAADNSEGVWMHLPHPTMGHPLYIGPKGSAVTKHGELNGASDAKPVRVKVLYSRCKSMMAKKRSLDRAATMNSGGKSLSQEAEDAQAVVMVKYAIVGFENVIHSGRFLDASVETDKDLFLSMADEYIAAVAGFSADLSHFFDAASAS